ncbi:MAG TPA: hypothetical protein VMK16_01345 [Acidimicrobiales bacterium]|nr:hypothetical protein [Acidimicrobiales bacterium]
MDESQGEKRKAAATVVNGTRVTVAFPFSRIALHEPSDDLRDLVLLVADLAAAVADSTGTEVAEDLRTRAVELRQRLAGGRNG